MIYVREKLLEHNEKEVEEWKLYRAEGEEDAILTMYPEDYLLDTLNKCILWFRSVQYQEFCS